MSDSDIDSANFAARVLEPFLNEDEAKFGLDDVAKLSGLDQKTLRDIWRALGFPDPRPSEQLFTSDDIEILVSIVGLIADGSIDVENARQFARVLGSSIDRIAAAQIDAWLRTAAEGFDEVDLEQSQQISELLPHIINLIFRRRLVTEARRRLLRASEDSSDQICVGFADLVEFTTQALRLESDALNEVVSRFESIAFDVVSRFGGRVVKTIGDEVMFVHDDPVQACRLALELAQQYRQDDSLSDVRVGLAYGTVLERDGDVYGHTVNLASRVVSVAFPGSVVISDELKDIAHSRGEFQVSPIPTHFLKGIGEVSLWRLRARQAVTTPA